jgi:hypothetical protein
MIVFVTACGDSGPDADDYMGLWQLTSVNTQPLPSQGNLTGGQAWVAGVLQLGEETGSFDWCWEDPSTATRTTHTDYVVLAPIEGDRIEVSFFGRRGAFPDTAALDGDQLTFRLRNVSINGETEAVDMLTFVPMPGPVTSACTLPP